MCRYMFACIGPTGMSVVWAGRTIAHGLTDLPAWDRTGGGDCGAATGHHIPAGSDLLEGWFRRSKPTACLPRGLKTKGCAMPRVGCNASGAWLVEVDSRDIGPPGPPPKMPGCHSLMGAVRLPTCQDFRTSGGTGWPVGWQEASKSGSCTKSPRTGSMTVLFTKPGGGLGAGCHVPFQVPFIAGWQ